MAEQPKVYIVHLNVTELVRGTNQSNRGNALTGLWVRGTVPKDGQIENWEKFLMDWNAAESIAAIEQAGVGAQVDIRMLKEGRFWNIQSVTNMGQGTQSTQGPPAQPATGFGPPVQSTPPPQPLQMPEIVKPNSVPVSEPIPAVQVKSSILDVKVIALNKSCDLTLGMMANGILKGAKVSPQIVYEGVIVLADRIVDYFENGGAVTPKSDTSPLKREPGSDDDPGVDDSDIPF